MATSTTDEESSSSPRGGKKSLSHHRESPKMTPQMLTLGRDARDDMLTTTTSPLPAAKDGSVVRPWWKKNPFDSNKDLVDEPMTPTTSAAVYSSLEDNKPSVEMGEQGKPRPKIIRPRQKRDATANYASLAVADHSHTKPAATLAKPTGRGEQLLDPESGADSSSNCDQKLPATTREEQVQQDCNFFYREMDERPQRRRIWSARRFLARDSLWQPEYSSVTAFSPPVLQRFRAKYAQLNQPITLPSVQDTDDYDLRLTEESSSRVQNWRHPSMSSTGTLEHSSLFYHYQGRMLMRLPRDRVRLLMDPDLEPGVISVEQVRKEDAEQDEEEISELRYILSVNDELYRSIVSEMSDHLTEPFCGIRGCCLDDEKVDIRVAVTIMAVVLFIIFITTGIEREG